MPKFKKSSGFKMRSTNKTTFKMMGSSPVKKLDDPSVGDQREFMGDLENIGNKGKDSIGDKIKSKLENLTEEEKTEIAMIAKEGADEIKEQAEKRAQQHLAKMDFEYQRSKFSGGETPSVYNPAGMPS